MKITIKESTEGLNLEMIRENCAEINRLSNLAKKLHKKDVEERTLIQKKLKELRENYKWMLFKKWVLTISNKGFHLFWEYDSLPKVTEIKTKKADFRKRLVEKRAALKKPVEEVRTMLGFKYKMTGGVFLKTGTIITLPDTVDQTARIRQSKSPHAQMKANYIGVELELISLLPREELEKEFIKAKLAGVVNIKSDGSIKTEQDRGTPQYTNEVTLLCRQDMVKDVLGRVCAVLNSSKIGAFVNNSCGLHVHLDARNRKPEVMYHNLFKALPMLSGMVPKCRTVSGGVENTYCKINKDPKFNAGSGVDRYQALNPTAFTKYKTIEVRLHSGSTNAAKIINWVNILTNIVDIETMVSDTAKNATDYGRIFNVTNSKLLDYIEKRTAIFTKEDSHKADTRGDHFWLNEFEIAI